MIRQLVRAGRAHWPEASIEAFGLGAFMVAAGLFGTLLEAPASPVRNAIADPTIRRVLMGLAMGLTAVGLIYSPWGARSGAHLNPAVTLSFLRLGKIAPADAALYIVSQVVGGIAGVMLVRSLVGSAFSAAPVSSVVTVPGPAGSTTAFVAELLISFLLMTLVLVVSNHPRWTRFTGLVAGTLIALYISFEAPLSGMSMNPARTIASALPSGVWTAVWIYFTAPVLGMLLAAEGYRRVRGFASVRCAKLHHTHRTRCIFRCGYATRRDMRQVVQHLTSEPEESST